MRYALSEAGVPRVISDCISSAASEVGFDSAQVAVLGDRILVQGSWVALGNGPIMNELIELNSACETQRREQLVNLIDVPGIGVAIEVTVANGRTLRARLQSATQNEAVASATAPISEDREIAVRDNLALTDVVTFTQSGSVERGLLGVASGRGQLDERILQLFSFSMDTITARGTLIDAGRLVIPTTSGVAAIKAESAWGDELGTFELDSDADVARSAIGEIRLPPL